MKQTVTGFLLALAALFVGGGILSAQVTTSSLNGLVADEAGVPVVGVAVLATHEPSGTIYTVITNEDGRYTINGMRSGGPYSVEFSCLGYQPMTYTEVTLQLAETFSLNVTMKEDSEMLSEAVIVASAASKFVAEKTGASTNISNRQMSALPTVNRSIEDVTRLSPYGGNGMSFAGTDGRTANFTVDGANFNNNFGLNDGLPGGGSPISIDAIEEVQVVISPYDVRQTNFIGGGVNAITKSGTNTFKGTAYIYHRNENMRGNAVEGQDIAGARDRDRMTTYGATLGGPIIKNKLFFFVNYEYSKVPTVANRWRASTDGKPDADSYISRTTVEDLTKVSNFVKEKYGYDTGSFTNFPADESNQKILVRLDWNIAQNHHLAVRYNYTLNKGWNSPNASSSDCATRAVYARMSQYSMSFANSMYSMDNIVHSVSLDLNSRINDNLSNQLLATFSKLDDVRGTNSDLFPFIDILDGTGTITPYMSLGYELFTYNNGVHNTVANVRDDITYYVGTHKITAGASYEYQMADNSYMRNGTGYYRYNSMEDFMNGAAPETVCLTYGYDGEDNPAARVRFHKVGVYAQDEWTPNEKFMLTYGVRLDGLFFSNQDIMTNNAILDLDYNGRHIDTGLWPSGKVSVSPRVGFTWDIFVLSGGIDIIPVLVGIFALSEVLARIDILARNNVTNIIRCTGLKMPGLKDLKTRWSVLFKSSIIGSFVGIMPGVGGAPAAFISYGEAKRTSPRKASFGEGEPDGILAPETANNAVTGGALVPTLALGLPGDAATAVMLATLMIHGVTPGVRLMVDSPDIVYAIFLVLFLCNFCLIPTGMLVTKFFSWMLRLHEAIFLPMVVIICILGTYGVRNSYFDLVVALIAGGLGIVLRYFKISPAPLVIGLVLGPQLEISLRQSILVTRGNIESMFIGHPIALVLYLMTILLLAWPFVQSYREKSKAH